jgi:hypothetical protein
LILKISKIQVKNLIDTHFHTYVVDDFYPVHSINSSELLTYNRFDLSFKLLFLDLIDKEGVIAKEVYKSHIKAFSLGKYAEPGNAKKNSIEKYYKDFQKIFKDIGSNGFSSDKSLIPLSIDGSISNGSHRLASAIINNENIEGIKLKIENDAYDYNFFYKRGVSEEILDIAATKFIEYANNVYIAIIWPSAIGHEKEISGIIKNIVYQKKVKLNYTGAHNLISQIYHGESWIGSEKDKFSGAMHKLLECFKTYNPVRVVAFQADNLKDVLIIKEKIRAMFKIGKHSIHITDNKEESVRVSRALFNDNSVHMMNHSDPNKYLQVHESILRIKDFASSNNLSYKDFVIDTSMVLALYGLRAAKDIDLLCNHNNLKDMPSGISLHDDELQYHQLQKSELIYNPNFYFYFNGLKFISFDRIFSMKIKRNEPKDIYDCKMMEALIENNMIKKYRAFLLQSVLYAQVKARSKIVSFLRFIGIYSTIKSIYILIKSKI